jgi:hypothetical protein
MMVKETIPDVEVKKFIKDLPAGKVGIKYRSLSARRGRRRVRLCIESHSK